MNGLIKNEIMYQNRFCGIFLEPGYLAALCSFLLFVDKYDLKKKENKILVLAVMVSLSLAGYIFLAVGYMLLRANKIVDLLKKIFGLLFYVLLFYTIFTNYDDGDNIVNNSPTAVKYNIIIKRKLIEYKRFFASIAIIK